MMIAAHDNTIDRVKRQYQLENLWYPEVIAVHPSLQARGLGKKVMGWVLDYAEHDPIIFKCTGESNISFHKRLGFEVVEEVELDEDDNAVRS
jgi:GNAT superfamily N-acetyltransferase